jgi:hypothetical protein
LCEKRKELWVENGFSEATKKGDPSGETGKTEALCNSKCDTIKIPSCSKAHSAEYIIGLNFAVLYQQW